MSDKSPHSLTPAQLKAILQSVSTSKVDKVDGKQLSTHDFSSEWLTRLANAGVYARQDNNRHAVNGIFALTKDATDEQIRAALTCFETKKLLAASDLVYCAENGSPLWDEATQGLVWVTHNGGNLFNLIELSMTNYTELPRLRFASLRFNTSTSLWSVTRPGQQERIAYHSERPALATPSTDGLLSAADKTKLDGLKNFDYTTIPLAQAGYATSGTKDRNGLMPASAAKKLDSLNVNFYERPLNSPSSNDDNESFEVLAMVGDPFEKTVGCTITFENPGDGGKPRFIAYGQPYTVFRVDPNTSTAYAIGPSTDGSSLTVVTNSASDPYKYFAYPITNFIPLATENVNGLMSVADKEKLDTISSEWYGTQDEYDSLSDIDPDTTYFIYE